MSDFNFITPVLAVPIGGSVDYAVTFPTGRFPTKAPRCTTGLEGSTLVFASIKAGTRTQTGVTLTVRSLANVAQSVQVHLDATDTY